MITDKTKRKVALFLKEFLGVGTTKLGTGGGGTNPTATDLDVPLSTTASNTATSSDDKVIEIKSSFTGTNLQGYTIREVGFFGNMATDTEMGDIESDGSFNADAADATNANNENMMYSRINFNAIGNFSTTDVIDIIYTMEVE
tara:strand:+ start:930 stop:1358 length:429 start_codon:yes stop_codon:yes gene_type:complete